MSSNGRYVRAPIASDNESTDDDYDLDNSSEPAVQEEERESDFSSDESSSNRSRSNEPNDAVNSSNRRGSVDPVSSPKMVSTDDRLQRMENALADITKALNVLQTPVVPNKDTDQIWSNPTALTSAPDIIPSSVRWDNIKPFPTRVAANKMWQEWNHYIENFEIAATLNNANDPVRRAQLLFLSVGEELQGIIRAAKLRPSLNDANCYRIFVDNIKNYLRTMTDSAAEHEAFLNMKQEKSESAVAFHARLMRSVDSCECSPAGQDKFIRAQLLKGLRNKELVKAARTFGHDTASIVLAATRDEAYQAETTANESSEVYAVNRRRPSPDDRRYKPKRSRSDDWGKRTTAKRSRHEESNFRRDYRDRVRRDRCSRCGQYSHRNMPCPALRRKCNSCHEFGHYAAVCRKASIQQLRMPKDESPKRENEQDENQV